MADPKLYLVGTPIGNLGDLSPRARDILAAVDFIAAEDTRVTVKLLNHFGIKKPMVSYYEHNLRERGEEILARIQGGESCAVVSDAGMPCICDPGEDLVRLCVQRGVAIETVPGPSAVVTALAVSGLPTGRFSFEGFLSTKRTSRHEHLQEIKNDRRTLVFYEAPHKLPATLGDMAQVLGGERRCAVVKELSKIHETVLRMTLGEAARFFLENTPKGEYVVVIEGASKAAGEERVSLSQAVKMVQKRAKSGEPMSKAAKEVAQISGYKKGELYTLALEENKNEHEC